MIVKYFLYESKLVYHFFNISLDNFGVVACENAKYDKI